MLQRLLGCDAVDGVVLQHLSQKVHSLGRNFGAKGRKRVLGPFGEGGLKILQFCHIVPHALMRSAEHFEDLEKLVDL